MSDINLSTLSGLLSYNIQKLILWYNRPTISVKTWVINRSILEIFTNIKWRMADNNTSNSKLYLAKFKANELYEDV